MNKILVFDIPARLLHWGFAFSLTASLSIGFLVDDDLPLFQLHMIFGIIAMFLLLVRIITGFIGSRYSRFSSYPLHPREIVSYIVSAAVSKTKLYAGNNPGSATAALLMFLLVPALFLTGTGIAGESFEELHETFAWALLVVIIFHLVGLAWHTFRHKENISLAMVTGKEIGKPEDAIASAHPAWAVILLIASGLWNTVLFSNHNAKTATVKLPGIGVTLSLGENEENESGKDDDDD